jgi:tetraacyldisaccharide-1-P 4'-kinase
MIGFSHAGEEGVPEWSSKLERWTSAEKFAFRTEISRLRSLKDQEYGRPGGTVFAFSGIGDHEAFLRSLTRFGITVSGDRRFADHHYYSSSEFADLAEKARSSGAAALVTTEKDAVRLASTPFYVEALRGSPPLFCAELSVEIVSGREKLELMIDDCLQGGPGG